MTITVVWIKGGCTKYVGVASTKIEGGVLFMKLEDKTKQRWVPLRHVESAAVDEI